MKPTEKPTLPALVEVHDDLAASWQDAMSGKLPTWTGALPKKSISQITGCTAGPSRSDWMLQFLAQHSLTKPNVGSAASIADTAPFDNSYKTAKAYWSPGYQPTVPALDRESNQ